MQSNFKIARKILGMVIFSVLCSFFVQISFYAMISQLSTEVVGYEVYQVSEEKPNGEFIEYIEKSEVPEKPAEDMRYMAVFSKMPKSAKAVETVLSTLFSLGIFICSVGSVLANAAAKDHNNSDFNDGEYDKARGLKIGAIAAIPSAICWLITVVLRFLPSSTAINWYFWFYRFVALGVVKPLNDVMTNVGTDLSAVPVWWVIFSIIYSLLFVLLCYVLYRACYNGDSWVAKLLYKKPQANTGRRLGGR